MPYITSVAGSIITAAWANTNIRDQVVTPFASAAARDAAILVPVEGMVAYLRDVKYLTVYNGTLWVPYGHQFSNTVATSQTTTQTSFADMATVGPTVTVATGTSALVTLSAKVKCSVADGVFMGCAVSGASTIAASTLKALTTVGTNEQGMSFTFLQDGLTPGVNTFTAKYRIAFSGQMTASDRNLIVVPLP